MIDVEGYAAHCQMANIIIILTTHIISMQQRQISIMIQYHRTLTFSYNSDLPFRFVRLVIDTGLFFFLVIDSDATCTHNKIQRQQTLLCDNNRV